ncbi:hypothetical protein [Actinomyces howellii]|uniref:Uncharacterized protein n=1 Tax=Actinomyces howellii TaxID=52771 RepID=A0A3S5EH78_9ACTO|nr:hypothetical protein [Actinomyces howellii]VEG30005.1 Uncharacterised protein [Actinomyces howellii]
MRAETNHSWAVTRGNHPDDPPYYAPLTQPRYAAARAEYARLLEPVPDDANSFWTTMADMAVVIPSESAAFWYQLTTIIETTWTPVTASTPVTALAAAARAEAVAAAAHPTTVHGDHPGTAQSYQPAPIQVTATEQWIATRASQDPNTDEDMWSLIIPRADRTTETAAQDACRAIIAELDHTPNLPAPNEPLTIWHSLRLTATTGWTSADNDTDPQQIARAITDHLTRQGVQSLHPTPHTRQ